MVINKPLIALALGLALQHREKEVAEETARLKESELAKEPDGEQEYNVNGDGPFVTTQGTTDTPVYASSGDGPPGLGCHPPSVYVHPTLGGLLCNATGHPEWLHNCECPIHKDMYEPTIDIATRLYNVLKALDERGHTDAVWDNAKRVMADYEKEMGK